MATPRQRVRLDHTAKATALSNLNDTLAGLSQIDLINSASEYQILRDGIWASWEGGTGTALNISGQPNGMEFELADIGQSDWLSLSFTLPLEVLHDSRYLVLIIKTNTQDFLSYRPSLRYLMQDRFEDRFCRDYIISTGGVEEQLSAYPVDPGLLEQSWGAEFHVFMQGSRFKVCFEHIEVACIS